MINRRENTQLEIFQSMGCLKKAQVCKFKRINIGSNTVDYIFIGNTTNSKACHLLIQKFKHPDIHDNMNIKSDNAKFFEYTYPYKNRSESSSERSKWPQEEPKGNTLIKRVQDVVNVKGYLLFLE